MGSRNRGEMSTGSLRTHHLSIEDKVEEKEEEGREGNGP